jgi:hypothetical protein
MSNFKTKSLPEWWSKVKDFKHIKVIPSFPRYGAHRYGYIVNLDKSNVLKTTVTKHGYTRVTLHMEGRKRQDKVHRLVAEAWFGLPKGMTVNHKNGVKTDNRAENLEYCTMSENLNHAWTTGLRDYPRAAERKVIDTSTGVIYSRVTDAAAAFNLKRSTLTMKLNGSNRNETPLKYYTEYLSKSKNQNL